MLKDLDAKDTAPVDKISREILNLTDATSQSGTSGIMNSVLGHFFWIVIAVIGFYFTSRSAEPIAESRSGGEDGPQKAGKPLSALVVVCWVSGNCQNSPDIHPPVEIRLHYR
jgi:hypothetical protein